MEVVFTAKILLLFSVLCTLILKHTHPRCSYSLTLKSKEAYLHFHQVKIPQVGAPVPPHSTSVCLCTATANNSQGEGNVLKLFFFSWGEIVCLFASEWDRPSLVCPILPSLFQAAPQETQGADPSSKSRLPTPIRSSLFLSEPSPH